MRCFFFPAALMLLFFAVSPCVQTAAQGSASTQLADALSVVPKKVFVTSKTYWGSLGGLVGADAKCQQLAGAAKLSGVYKAWLASYPVGPLTTFAHSKGPYQRVDGVIVANDWISLITKPLLAPISVDQEGQLITTNSPSSPVWTGISIQRGTLSYFTHVATCNGWTENQGVNGYGVGPRGFTGIVNNRLNFDWSSLNRPDFHGTPCDKSARLYCFEQ